MKLLGWLLYLFTGFLILACGVSSFFLINSYFREKNLAINSAPSGGTFIVNNDENIFVQTLGNKQKNAVLFIHGTGSWSSLWQASMKSLSELGYYCIAMDFPPFGYTFMDSDKVPPYDRATQAQRIYKVLESLGVEKVSLVGHSFGGRATITAALLHPNRVERLVLIDIALGFGKSKNEVPEPLHPAMKFILERDFGLDTLASMGSYPSFMGTFVRSFVTKKETITPEIVSMYQEPLYLKNKSRLMGFWMKDFMLNDDHELVTDKEAYKKFKAATIILWGATDSITPLWQAEALKEYFPHAQLKIIEGVGHIPMIEDNEVFQKLLIEAFIK